MILSCILSLPFSLILPKAYVEFATLIATVWFIIHINIKWWDCLLNVILRHISYAFLKTYELIYLFTTHKRYGCHLYKIQSLPKLLLSSFTTSMIFIHNPWLMWSTIPHNTETSAEPSRWLVGSVTSMSWMLLLEINLSGPGFWFCSGQVTL